MILNSLKGCFVPAVAAILVLSSSTTLPALAAPIKNIVLVHGASVYESRPKEVAGLIEDAAQHAQESDRY